MLALTQSAVDAVRRVMEDGDEAATGMRIAVEAGGCSGFQYKLHLEAEALEGDQVFEFTDVKIYVGADSQAYLAGTELDFVETVEGAGFVFNNPNAKSSCGCGKSFC
jgi:iron-sulfur cluster assembly protein